ncbi:LytTR family transcriptional regulator DNA-binding domain-containing protein [Mucilaginibacter corticis]|uniref:LytTR family transcriptional regulator DNA-binding domain-containing protein n=1 Tax=Mucilaginibacter corticis TaxID=2597670 RepID=UPI0016423A3B
MLRNSVSIFPKYGGQALRDIQLIHRSFIININHIKKIHKNRLWIEKTEIPIGKTYKN